MNDTTTPVTPAPRRLIAALGVGAAGWSLPSAAAASLMQASVADAYPDAKLGVFAAIGTVGAVVASTVILVVGSLSDRTVSRFGRRTPWMLVGALVAGIALLATWFVDDLVGWFIGFALFQAGLNTVTTALAATMSDRVEPRSLGGASASAGVGYLVGYAAGGIVTSVFVTAPARGFLALAPVIVILTLVAARMAPEPPATSSAVRSQGSVVGSVVPTRDRDLLLAFAGRFLTVFALVVIAVQQLFVLTDYVGLSTERAGGIIAVGGLLLAVFAAGAAVAGGAMSDRLGRRVPIVAGSGAVLALAALVLTVFDSVPAYLVFTVLAGTGYGAYLSVDQALMVQVLPRTDSAARDLGFLTIANTAPVVVAPLIAAGVVTVGGFRSLFLGAAVAAIAGSFCISRIRRVR